MAAFFMIAVGLALYKFELLIDDAFGPGPLIFTPIFLILVIRKWVLSSSMKKRVTELAELQEDSLLSAANEREGGTMSCCASCGIKESDDVKLKDCGACHLVKYCGSKCQKEHRPKHKQACKQRAAELHDELLFRQPESSHLGDCPICFLPLSLEEDKSTMMTCCSKVICNGCAYASYKREVEGKLAKRCAFCRLPEPVTDKEEVKLLQNRAEMNDPVAMCQLGTMRCGEGDYQSAFQYLSKAAELGGVASHYQLAGLYHEGQGVEKDELKEWHHLEQAAIGGHPKARFNLGCDEWNNDRCERAVKHWIIAAKLGHGESLEGLKEAYKHGLVVKDDLAAAFRGHQAAVDATKSSQRDEMDAIDAAAILLSS